MLLPPPPLPPPPPPLQLPAMSSHSEWHLTSPLVYAQLHSRTPHHTAHKQTLPTRLRYSRPAPSHYNNGRKKKVDDVPRPDWSFKVFPFPDGYAACVARGPPSACSPSGKEAGVISDPDAPERGQSLPQLRFRKVGFEELVPRDAAARLFGRGL